MTLSADDTAKLAVWLAESGLAGLELTGPGVRVMLRRDGVVASSDAPPVVVTAPSVGVFLDTHPLREAPLAPAGTLVEPGEPVGLLRIGSLLLPVPAPTRAIAGEIRAIAGARVGYGTPLIDLRPVTD
jgi:acetyl-CoA carboxylase biotin carboxyl carrier protein